jgi:hypothetical protein
MPESPGHHRGCVTVGAIDGSDAHGGQANLTDAELRSAILYMYNPAGEPGKH